jgi:raffinose/stachyose/melibiose transport system permease protein
MKKKTISRLGNNLVAVFVSAIMFVPIYLVVVNSLKDKVQASSMGVGLPTSLHWQNFAVVIEKGKLVQAFGNSLLYASASTIVAILLSAAAAYVLSRNQTRLNRYLLHDHYGNRHPHELCDSDKGHADHPPD